MIEMIALPILIFVNGLLGYYLGFKQGKEEGMRMVVAKALKERR